MVSSTLVHSDTKGGFILGVSQLEDACDRFMVVDKSFFGCMRKEEHNSEMIQALVFCKILTLRNAVAPRKAVPLH